MSKSFIDTSVILRLLVKDEEGFTTVYTYDESDFKKIKGLNVKTP